MLFQLCVLRGGEYKNCRDWRSRMRKELLLIYFRVLFIKFTEDNRKVRTAGFRRGNGTLEREEC
jgi:hypothetical protein